MYKALILHVALYECETWSLREERRPREFENRVLRRMLGTESVEVGENCLMRIFITSALRQSR